MTVKTLDAHVLEALGCPAGGAAYLLLDAVGG